MPVDYKHYINYCRIRINKFIIGISKLYMCETHYRKCTFSILQYVCIIFPWLKYERVLNVIVLFSVQNLIDSHSLKFIMGLTQHHRATGSLLHLHTKKKPPSISAQFQVQYYYYLSVESISSFIIDRYVPSLCESLFCGSYTLDKRFRPPKLWGGFDIICWGLMDADGRINESHAFMS